MTDASRRASLSKLAFVALFAAPLVGCTSGDEPFPTPTPAAARASAVAPVVPGFATLAGSQSPLARAQWEVGRMDATTKLEGMSLLLKMSPEQKTRSRGLLFELQDPMSPRYHQWLKPADVAASFGAASSDLASATAWLASQGFTVHGASPTGTRVLFSGTVAQLEQAFHTEVHRYEVHGESHFGLSMPPSVPDDLARFVLGLHGVHDFRLHPTNRSAAKPALHPDSLFDAGLEGGVASQVLTLAPADFATIYDVNALYAAGITGSGQKIAIMGEGDFNDADVIAFRTTYGLDTSLVPIRDQVPLSGKSNVQPFAYGETILDLEWSGAVAKEATIYYVYSGSNINYSVYDAVAWAIEEGLYPVLSISYGGCEQGLTPSEDIYLETMGDAAAMEGITVVNASGDLGPATCEYNEGEKAATQGISVSWPSSIPSFVAVGGTMLNWGDPIPEALITPTIASAAPFDTYWTCSLSSSPTCAPTGYVGESAWNETAYEIADFEYFWGASGGGISTLFTKPYWQVGQTPTGTMRLLPDVSLTAAYAQVGYLVSQSWTSADGDAMPPQPEALQVTGGTSAAAPSFAGILGLVNQALAAKYPTLPVGLGNANPLLYAINASTSGGSAPAFHDITTGDTYVPCRKGTPDCPTTAPYQYGYPAGPGFDMATGIGSIDVNNLVTAWTSLTPTSTTLSVLPSGTTEGSAVKLSAIVSSNATSTSMTGSVVFYVDTVDEGGLSDLALNATGTLTATLTAGLEGGTATASVVVPPGVLEMANVVAFYGGDAHYLASWSAPDSVASKSTLAISPSSVTLHPKEQQKFTTSGGVPPIQWTIVRDTTCFHFYECADVESVSATAGDYQAGGKDGTTEIAAIDSEGAEVRVLVTVAGLPVDGGMFPPPWDGGYSDASVPADAKLEDAKARDASKPKDASTGERPEASVDAGSKKDAGAPSEPPSSGCSCRAAGSPTDDERGGALAALFLGLTFVGRRRRNVAI